VFIRKNFQILILPAVIGVDATLKSKGVDGMSDFDMESLFDDVRKKCSNKEERNLVAKARSTWDQYEASLKGDDIASMIGLLYEVIEDTERCVDTIGKQKDG